MLRRLSDIEVMYAANLASACLVNFSAKRMNFSESLCDETLVKSSIKINVSIYFCVYHKKVSRWVYNAMGYLSIAASESAAD